MYRNRVGIILGIIFCCLVGSCSSLKQVPIETKIQYRVVDSIAWHDTTVYNYINKERIVDIVPTYDTLRMETNVAKAESYIDTLTKTLRGSIENKDVEFSHTIKWKEKIIRKDSLVVQQIPVEVTKEVIKYPKSYWYLLGFFVISIVLLGIRLYLKFIK